MSHQQTARASEPHTHRRLPFAARRTAVLVRGLTSRRRTPDIDALGSIEDAETFIWRILPYAARTFATSIAVLPENQARAAAIAYLYCRMLDTYEDMVDPSDRAEALEAFAARMETMEPPPSVPVRPQDEADAAHVVLLDRIELVDAVFGDLDAEQRMEIIDLVTSMAHGMIWAADRFAEQGGVLDGEGQVSEYCHHVIGGPVVYALRLVRKAELTDELVADALAVSELVQLANITRDIEKDLHRGIAYDADLKPHLGETHAAAPVAAARRRLMEQALPNVSAYTRLAEAMASRGPSLARASALLMLLHTDRHYSWCAKRVGLTGWRTTGRASVLWVAAVGVVSRRWSRRVMRRVEHNMLGALEQLS